MNTRQVSFSSVAERTKFAQVQSGHVLEFFYIIPKQTSLTTFFSIDALSTIRNFIARSGRPSFWRYQQHMYLILWALKLQDFNSQSYRVGNHFGSSDRSTWTWNIWFRSGTKYQPYTQFHFY